MIKNFQKFDYNKVPVPIRGFLNRFMDLHFVWYPYKGMRIIGITGTKGKTTTSNLLYKIANSLGYKSGIIGTVGDFIDGEKLSIKGYTGEGSGTFLGKFLFCSITNTTPEVWEMNRILSIMKKKGCEYVFMEVSSHAIKENRVNRLKFEGAIFTNFSQDHLDYHKDMEDYFLSKKKLFKMLPSSSFALSNIDDERGLLMVENIKAKKYLYGFGDLEVELPNGGKTPKWRDFHGKILKSDISGLDLDLGGERVNTKLVGKFNAYNLLATWSACKLLGFDMKKVKEIIKDIDPPAGRLDRLLSPSGVLVAVDYAHSPQSLKEVLLTVNEIKQPGARVISVFGCGGDRDPKKRPIMGKIGAEFSDIAIFTSDNPRSEDPEKIIEAMKGNLSHEDTQKVITISDRRLAIRQSLELAKKGDIILCAGKGHETYQVIKGVHHHFSDKEEYEKAFKLL